MNANPYEAPAGPIAADRTKPRDPRIVATVALWSGIVATSLFCFVVLLGWVSRMQADPDDAAIVSFVPALFAFLIVIIASGTGVLAGISALLFRSPRTRRALVGLVLSLLPWLVMFAMFGPAMFR